MRICLLTHVFPARREEPAAVFVFNLARGLTRRGHAVHVVAPWRDGAADTDLWDGVRVHRFRHAGRFADRLGALRAVPPATLAAFLIAMARTAARRVREEKLDLIHAYWVAPGGVAGVLAGRLANVPVVATAAGTDLNELPDRAPAARAVVSWTLQRLDGLIALGSALRARAIRLGTASRRARVILEDAGVDPAFAAAGRAARPTDGPPVLLFAGRLAHPKRVDLLLAALPAIRRAHPAARLRIIGDGEERERLEAAARRLGVAEAVDFLGARPHAELPAHLAESTLVVYPSLHEGLPCAISEALAAGVPVLASPVGGIPDYLNGGATGVAVPEYDPTAWAAAVNALLADRARRERLAAEGRRFAARALAPERILSQVESFYADVVGGRL